MNVEAILTEVFSFCIKHKIPIPYMDEIFVVADMAALRFGLPKLVLSLVVHLLLNIKKKNIKCLLFFSFSFFFLVAKSRLHCDFSLSYLKKKKM